MVPTAAINVVGSRELMAIVCTFQHGISHDIHALATLPRPVLCLHGGSKPNAGQTDQNNPAIAAWLQIYSLARLPRVFAYNPFLAHTLALYSVQVGDVDLLKHLGGYPYATSPWGHGSVAYLGWTALRHGHTAMADYIASNMNSNQWQKVLDTFRRDFDMVNVVWVLRHIPETVADSDTVAALVARDDVALLTLLQKAKRITIDSKVRKAVAQELVGNALVAGKTTMVACLFNVVFATIRRLDLPQEVVLSALAYGHLDVTAGLLGSTRVNVQVTKGSGDITKSVWFLKPNKLDCFTASHINGRTLILTASPTNGRTMILNDYTLLLETWKRTLEDQARQCLILQLLMLAAMERPPHVPWILQQDETEHSYRAARDALGPDLPHDVGDGIWGKLQRQARSNTDEQSQFILPGMDYFASMVQVLWMALWLKLKTKDAVAAETCRHVLAKRYTRLLGHPPSEQKKRSRE
ncbi:Aste57867_18075 [Aphanomyces stellatus]|uniref:Aste57867_18075 protein n=1 Tax=Aphanomyces stellatus TaxID=120398 RepID=A0A485L954_9STRA|nr:hypothetical protein As57867_018013 [Aphanomyces stellatus]VFT94814.1 Aste57867_18075 [Aphanomyces stellatus]